MTTKTIFSERLKQARLLKNFTQSEMASKMETTQGAYQKWESGAREPNLGTIVQLSEILDTSIDYLFGKTDYPRQDWQPIELVKLTKLTDYNKSQLDKLKFSIMFEITRNKLQSYILKDRLIMENDLNDDDIKILNKVFKEVALEMYDLFETAGNNLETSDTK